MSALPTVEPTKTGTDDAVTHLYCCNPDQGICGIKGIAQEPEIDGKPPHLCVVCDDLDQYPCETCGWTP